MSSLSGWAQSSSPRLVGSDYLVPLLAESNDLLSGTDLAFRGSYAALRELESGKASIGLLFWTKEMEDQFGKEWKVLDWGYYTLWVVTAEQNPLEELTLPQVEGIYLSGRDNRVSRWGDLGLPGIWEARAVTPLFYRDSIYLSEGAFMSRLSGEHKELRANVRYYENAEEAVKNVEEQNSSILVVPYGSSLTGAKALPLVGDKGPVAYKATPENLASGRYPLSLPVKLVYKVSEEARLKPILNSFYDVEVLERAGKLGIAPLPDSVRMRYQLDFGFVE